MSLSLEEVQQVMEEDFHAKSSRTHGRSRKTAKRREMSDKKLSRGPKGKSKRSNPKTQELRRIRAWVKREEEKERRRASAAKGQQEAGSKAGRRLQRKLRRNSKGIASAEMHLEESIDVAPPLASSPEDIILPDQGNKGADTTPAAAVAVAVAVAVSATMAEEATKEMEEGECSCPDTSSEDEAADVEEDGATFDDVAKIFEDFVADEDAMQLELTRLSLRAIPLQAFPQFKGKS